jgi:hypothetical protein
MAMAMAMAIVFSMESDERRNCGEIVESFVYWFGPRPQGMNG